MSPKTTITNYKGGAVKGREEMKRGGEQGEEKKEGGEIGGAGPGEIAHDHF